MLSRLNELFIPPSSAEWMCFIFILLVMILCIVSIEYIRKRFHWPAEVTRKFVHIITGFIIFFAVPLFQSAFIPMVFAWLAIFVTALAIRMGLLPGIHGTSRISYGTIFYPISFLLLIPVFWISHREIILLSMLGLATGDAAAAIVGETFKPVREYRLTSDKKSIEGSLTMLLVTSIILFGGMHFLGLQHAHSILVLTLATVAAAILATAWEALSSKGLDNLTIPLSIAFVLSYYLIPGYHQDIHRFTAGVLLSILIAYASYRLKFLNASGSVAVVLLASTIYGIGGWQWTIPILIFFIFSSFLSIAGKQKKKQFEHLFEKSSTRDYGQVAANGGVAGIIMLGQYIFPAFDLFPLYLGSIAAVTADTWGTEIGVWFGGRTISIIPLKAVEPGTNGGISMAGFLGGAAGAAIVSLTALPWVSMTRIIFISTLSGIIGSCIDSLFGGTLQSIYQCPVCRKYTERTFHCGSKTFFKKGIRWMTNDVVNWGCACTGAAVSWLLR
jgi:uncharacterized protein (TIGR00297 family)